MRIVCAFLLSLPQGALQRTLQEFPALYATPSNSFAGFVFVNRSIVSFPTSSIARFNPANRGGSVSKL
jgi:hypothetical protein